MNIFQKEGIKHMAMVSKQEVIKKIMATGQTKLEDFIMQNSVVNNEILRNHQANDLLKIGADGMIHDEKTEIATYARKNSSLVSTFYSFLYGDNIDESIYDAKWVEKITAYDKRVYNAVCTLYIKGKTTFSINELYSVLTGYAKSNPTSTQVDALITSLKKLKSIVLFIDLTEEFNANLIKNKQVLIDAGYLKKRSDKFKRVKIEDNLLHINIGSFESEMGRNFQMIQVFSEPALLTYNRAKNTLITIPMEYVGMKDMYITNKTVAFQDYLLMRILSHKNGAMKENKVMYETLYKETGLEKPKLGKDFINDRNLVKKFFDEWIKDGLIISYEEVKKGRSYVGIQFGMQN